MSDRLTIAIDARELAGHPTGVGRYLAGVLQHWAREDFPHRLHLMLPDTPPGWLAGLPLDLTTTVAPARPAGTWWEQITLPRLVRTAAADVLLAPAYTAPLRASCPTVLIVHDVSFWAQPRGFRWREGMRRRYLTRVSARRAARVLTVSEFSAREIAHHLRVPLAAVGLAPQGAPPWAGGPPFAQRTPLVLSVGTLFARRHLPLLLDAVVLVRARRPDVRLVVVGGNQIRPPADPEALIAARGLADHVTWHPWLPDHELEAHYAAARAFAFLSDYEGFAMTPMEAAAHGVPSVLLDTPVAREVYGDAALRVDPSPTAVADALTTLLTSETDHAAIAAAARRRLDAFRWSRTAAAVREALEGAAQDRP